MALALNDRVQQQGTANTTVSFTLTTSVTGFQSFAVIGNGNTTYYSATDASGNWEVGIGTYSTTGPTLTRTTILSSSNSNTAVTFSGTVNVFVTYPSEKSVNLDGSDNVSALGTVSSGTWQGSTVGVAYGGTGVTSSSGANSVMLRDANQNVAVNRLNQSNTNTTAAGGTTALTAASSYSQTLNGTGNQTYTMPDATTLTTGVAFVFNNNATGTLTLQDYASGPVGTITSGGAVELVLLSNGTVAGTWDVHGYLPEAVTWGTNALNLGTTVITNGTWNGGTIGTAYGGTGLTSFSAANYALYSTSSSALTAGTLPVAAGGTGATSLTGYTYGNGTGAFTASTTIPFSAITGTVPVNQGGTGQTSYTDGQLLIGNSTGNTLTKASLTAGTGISITPGSGSISIASTVTSGVTITNDTSTATSLYPTFTSATSGSVSGLNVTSTKLTFVPSTGTLTAPNVEASNGLFVNNATVTSNYTIPNGYNASSVGPVTVASGAAVTIPSGSRWLVL